MLVYRIAKHRHAADLTGAGAREHGGRWNRKGTALVYSSVNPALATVEYLVHVDPLLQPSDLRMISIEVPDRASIESVRIEDLPRDWSAYPAPAVLADYGTNWAASARSLGLRVPSAVVAGDYNLLLNPRHPEAAGLLVVDVAAYSFAPRLLPKRT